MTVYHLFVGRINEKNLWADFHEISAVGRIWTTEELLKLWK